MKLYIALENALAVIEQRNGQWMTDLQLVGRDTQCVAVDPLRHEWVYCGSFDQGLWQSDDGGKSWRHVGEGITHKQVMSVAVSATERVGEHGVVYAGTEPSALFRSEDGGRTWIDLAALRQLPSAPQWSYPPRPYTSHVRSITPDPLQPGHVFVAIEAGALVRTFDGGQTWEDRKPNGPLDTHTLAMHRFAPNKLYSAAGDGFMRPGNGFVTSDDGGDTWYRPDQGLKHNYLWSVAVDSGDPSTIVISSAHGPQQAHNPMRAESAIYYRSSENAWRQARAGLPETHGMLVSVIVADPTESGTFFAANNKGIFRSSDGGESWEALSIGLPESVQGERANAFVVVED